MAVDILRSRAHIDKRAMIEKQIAKESTRAEDILPAVEEEFPRNGRLATPSPSRALETRRAPPAPMVGERWPGCPSHGRVEYNTTWRSVLPATPS